jgi:predicted secreted hydrolase
MSLLRRLRWVLIPLDLLGLLVLVFLVLWSRHYHLPPETFTQASPDRPIFLPRDEAAHMDVANEWWYYTGHLERDDGVRYGFELVFFKLYAPATARLGPVPLRWLTSPVYLAQFAVTEEETGQFVYFERSNIPFFWQGGAEEDRYTVWVGGWWAAGERGAHHLRAAAGNYALSLDLRAEGDSPVQHGQDGLVSMGSGGFSYYTSYPRMAGSGTLQVDGRPYRVQALAWMDHQWGSWDWSSFAGWDWAGLQLDDGSALMLFHFRGAGGQPNTMGGTYIAPGGHVTPLGEGDIRMRETAHWTSPETGGIYPAGWEVEIVPEGLSLAITPTVAGQEIASQVSPIYWEGSVQVGGDRAGRALTGSTRQPITGVGYMELTGYVRSGHGR